MMPKRTVTECWVHVEQLMKLFPNIEKSQQTKKRAKKKEKHTLELLAAEAKVYVLLSWLVGRNWEVTQNFEFP